jgi:hypothetical protein
VIGHAAGNRLPAPLTARGVVLAGELPRGLDGLGAAAHEERPVEVTGRRPRKLGGQLDRARVGERPVDRERQLAHLRRRGLTHLGAEAVAGVAAEEAGESIEVALAVRVLEVATLAADDHLQPSRVEVAHRGEVEPQVTKGVVREPVRSAVGKHAR